jgi:peptidyl-prolyl cis-trans isomerase SurA
MRAAIPAVTSISPAMFPLTPSLFRLLTAFAVAFVLGATSSIAPAAAQQQGQRIVATVNDDIISRHDLDNRIALFLATSNLPDTPENRQRLAPEVLRTLVDDTLKRQEMRKQNITVSQAEIDRALVQIAGQLRIQPADLPAYLAQRGVSMPTLIDQLESEIGWLKAVTRIAGDRATVGADEVDEELVRASQNVTGVEYRVSEIFLSLDDPAEQQRVEELALRLVSEARSGANFAALARTFSQGPSAPAGGDLGWVPRDELDRQIEQVVSALQPGQVSDPIRGQGGYFILALAGRRSGDATAAGRTTVSLRQLFLPLARNAAEPQVSAQANAAREIGAASGCADFEDRAKQEGATTSGTPGMVDIQQLPPELRQLVQPLAPGRASQPVRTVDGFLVVMVCDRQEEAAGVEQRAAVERRLRDQRLSSVARRHLRELRRTALLDIRG